MRDERQLVDAQRGVNAAGMNLTFWQSGGIGLVAPKAVFAWQPPGGAGVARLLYGGFVWDDVVYVDQLAPFPPYFSVVETPGVLTFTFPSALPGRPDEDGLPTSNPFSISAASAQVIGILDPQGSTAEVDVVTPQSVEVRTYVGLPRVPTPDLSVIVELF